MKQSLVLLWKLQILEQEKRKILTERKLIQSDDIYLLQKEIVGLTNSIANDQERYEVMRYASEKKEKEIAFISSEYKELEKKLYGGEIKSSKELEQMQMRFSDAQQDVEKEEAFLYSALEDLDVLAATIKNNEKLSAKKKKLVTTRQRETKQLLLSNEEAYNKVDKECKLIIEQVDPSIWKQYLILSRKFPMPIARIQNGICSGCNISVPQTQINNQDGKAHYCDNCGRIIFVD